MLKLFIFVTAFFTVLGALTFTNPHMDSTTVWIIRAIWIYLALASIYVWGSDPCAPTIIEVLKKIIVAVFIVATVGFGLLWLNGRKS